MERWDALVERFKETLYTVHALTPTPLLEIALQLGLSCLKTPYVRVLCQIVVRSREEGVCIELTRMGCGAQILWRGGRTVRALPHLRPAGHTAGGRVALCTSRALDAGVPHLRSDHERAQPTAGPAQRLCLQHQGTHNVDNKALLRGRVGRWCNAGWTHESSAGVMCAAAMCAQALEEMAERNDGLVTCPRTEQVYALSEARKAFIL